ncbi:MAG TPA: rod-binding protein [Oligoflexus sp.]|uniref:rod-binding protein n=1 Tax=Oligoflexus sp. TaxID=1971216 RepID=UPI002D574795|nr:rod-binding protein [Oligoflexus sp.]HYX34068.1 rod-binding protein [Oligoflexus sp.]
MAGIDKLGNYAMESADFDRFSKVNQKTPDNVDAIKKLADEFEGIFLEIVLKSMRETVDKSQFIDGGNGEQIFQSMLDSEYAKNLASQRTTGLAVSIEQHLLGMMGESKASDAMQKALGKAQYEKAK